MHILCPHCRNPIEVVKLNPREEITCPSCGSSFHLETESTATWHGKNGQKLGKYELLGAVGQGAFGTVYKARDPELDRVVAVKVPRAGTLAGPEDLDRFLREARSVAQLRHPSIVPVHDVGQVDGVPYLVSDFVQGVTLTDRLSARRPGFREAAELIAAVADALQYAHDHGVIHRDVKPSNIMIGEDGTAFVMDFGLAKRDAGEITMTVEGQVLGTPAYMSPEQARGESHAVDARGDVYSLGVVLYQMLTGELPFRGTKPMLLHQVLHDEPRSPRSLNDHIPRDLQTITLKAMAKEPGRRYATARDFAEDLRRWLKGEAIRARPIGRVERAARWAKRNPALTASFATIVGVLLTGTAISTLFGIDAHTKETAAVAARNDLATKNTELEQSRAEVVKQNTALELSQDKLEGALARTWLSPLAENPGPLNDAEIGAFTELARHRNERLAQRFVAEALSDRQGVRRLRARAAFALHAAVGLDPGRRQEAEGRLVRALEAPDLPEESRTDLALAASELGALTPSAAAVVAHRLVRALMRTNSPYTLRSLADGLSAVAARLEPKKAAAAAAEATTALTLAMTKTNDPTGALHDLTQGLSALAVHLEPKEAAEAVATLRQVLTKTNDPVALESLAQGLSALAARLEPKKAAEAFATLTLAMTKTNDFIALRDLAHGVSAQAARVESKDAAEAAATFTLVMAKTSDPRALRELARGLSAVVARLEPKEAAEAAAALTLVMSKTNDPVALESLAQGLSALAARLEPKKAARASAEAAATLTLAITKTNNPTHLYDLAQGLSRVAARLETHDAAEAAATLRLAMTKTSDPPALESLVHALVAVAARLEPQEAAATLTQAMTKTNDSNALRYLAQGMSAVAARLETKEAARVCTEAAATLALAITKTNNPTGLDGLALGLSAVAIRLESKEATRICTEAATTLTQAMVKTNDAFVLGRLAEGLSTVAARLEREQAAHVLAAAAAKLTQAMANDSNALPLAQGLSAVAAHLEPKEAARVSSEAAATLTLVMTKTDNPRDLHDMADGLSVLAVRLEPKGAAEAAATLRLAMTKTSDPLALESLTRALAAVLGNAERDRRSGAVAATVGYLPNSQGLLAALLLLHPASEPFPRRLSEQELVNLLKHPLCVGRTRRAVLDHLENHHRRTFADQWEFVRFAEEKKLGLDFTSPPKRP